MNWQQYYTFFEHLEPAEVDLFATPRETKQVLQTYNRALEMLKSDKKNQQKALELLANITADYPMFAEATHVYAISLAAAGDYNKAVEHFKKAALLDIDDQQANMLSEQIKLVEREIQLQKRQKRNQKPVQSKRKEVSIADILEKSTAGKRRENISREEINTINKQLGNENPADLSGEIASEERKSTFKFAVLVVIIAIITLLIFYFGIRPAIMRLTGQDFQTAEQLEWLEKEITDRAKKEPAMEELLDDYLKKFTKQGEQ